MGPENRMKSVDKGCYLVSQNWAKMSTKGEWYGDNLRLLK
jgi:hypothetical protein